MRNPVEVIIDGLELQLFAERAVYCRKHRLLLIADTHFGKDATFRHHSIPVPQGSTQRSLSRLKELTKQINPRHIVVLGDMFHARSSMTQAVMDGLHKFVRQFPEVSITLVRGNHDQHIEAFPDSLNIRIETNPLFFNELVLSHLPGKAPPQAKLMLCGHIHPALRIGAPSDRLRLPCFWLKEKVLILPAFGEFTGSEVIKPHKHDRVWLIAGGVVTEHATANS